MPILEYEVIVAHTEESLIKAVNDLIDDGWQPYGSLSFTTKLTELTFVQPMTKETPATPRIRHGRYHKS